jgi:hypothetical protein
LFHLKKISNMHKIAVRTFNIGLLIAPFATCHGQWTATFLGIPNTNQQYSATGASGGFQVGYSQADGFPTAVLWNGSSPGVVVANDAEFLGVSDGVEVGYQEQVSSNLAATWQGSNSTPTFLNPAGYAESTAAGISGNTEVGWGDTGQPFSLHALMWHGTAASAVDLNPTGYIFSQAFAVDGSIEVGDGGSPAGTNNALMWQGSASSAINLSPAGFGASFATGVSGSTEVGWAYVDQSQTTMHAFLWHGSSASAVDLTPSWAIGASASAASGNWQVGTASTATANHAVLWTGTSASAIDLNASLPPGWQSGATGVDAATGEIVGYAYAPGNTNQRYAVEWSEPTPEPLSIGILAVSGIALVKRRNKAACKRSIRN